MLEVGALLRLYRLCSFSNGPQVCNCVAACCPPDSAEKIRTCARDELLVIKGFLALIARPSGMHSHPALHQHVSLVTLALHIHHRSQSSAETCSDLPIIRWQTHNGSTPAQANACRQGPLVRGKRLTHQLVQPPRTPQESARHESAKLPKITQPAAEPAR